MRNYLRKVGIVALAAIIGIGLFIGCGDPEEDPEMKITISGLSSYNDNYAMVMLLDATTEQLVDAYFGDGDPDELAIAGTYYTAISGGSVTLALLDADEKPLKGKAGTYVVFLDIATYSDGRGYEFMGVILSQSIGKESTSIAFNTFIDIMDLMPLPDGTQDNPFPLEAGEWLEGEVLRHSDEIFYAISVTNGTTYTVWWDDAYSYGSGYETADIRVAAKYQGSSSWDVFGNVRNAAGTSTVGVDIGYTNADRPDSTFTANRNGVVLVRVISEAASLLRPGVSDGTVPGTYSITYTVGSSVRPRITFPAIIKSTAVKN